MKAIGLVLIGAALLVPMIWLPSIGAGRDSVALASQYLGLMSLIAMAFAQLIATRWRIVEAVFGPMDQSYRVHKWLGIGAMVALLLHDTIDADMRGLGAETLLVELAETLGEISLYGLLILVVITIATFIPYHLWKWTHRLIGVFFLLGAFHYLFIQKPFGNLDPLGLYMLVVLGVGLVAYVYTSAPRGLRPSRGYRIRSVTEDGSALAVDMEPTGQPLRHRPGQFAFFAFTGGGLTEPHPFTISKAPSKAGDLRITVAPLGDYTSRVRRALSEGQTVKVDGPYGHFGRPTKKPQVWVAGGVGVTPFVALAQALVADAAPVRMIYAVPSQDSAAHLAELEAIAASKPGFELTVWESRKRGRLSVDDVARIAGGDIAASRVLFCGPTALRKALGDGLRKHGVPQSQFQYEQFEIRTGIGLRRFASFLWNRRLAGNSP